MIGYMPQQTCLSKGLTARELLTFFGRIYGIKSKKIEERIKFLMELVEISDVKKVIANESGGQQRRISFAVSLMHEPKIVFLDEPTVGLDPLLRMKIWDFLIEEAKLKRLTVIITTHYVEHAKEADCVSYFLI
jgi:ABC-type multidrug transport system ATPase subunit